MTTARDERGSALIIVLVMIVILSSLAAFAVSDGFYKWRIAEELVEKTKTLHMAEAGLDRAIAEINASRNGTLGSAANPVLWGGGSYFTTASDWSTNGLDDNGVNGIDDIGEKFYYTVTSTGRGDRDARWPVQTRVVAIVKREPMAGFTRAMFGDIGVDLRGAVLTDSYDSDVGPFGSNPRGTKGDVGSNQLVQLGGTVDVWGSATSGPGYTTDKGTAFVFGSTASATTTITLPPVTYAPPAGCLPAVSGGTIASSVTSGITLGNGNYRCSSIALANKQVFAVNGDAVLYVDGDIHMSAQSCITITSGRLTIYQNGGRLDLTGGNEVNGYYDKTARKSIMGKPAQMLIFSNTDQSIKLVGNAEASACLYAPRAEIDLRGVFAFYGSVIGRSIVNTGNPDFHYDEALGRLQVFPAGPCCVKAWNENSN